MGSNVKLVSFDVFDTLVTRCVTRPTDIFKCIERLENLSIDGIRDFSVKRRDAERCAIEKVGPHALTISDIYECMEGYTDQEKKILQAAEIEAEKSLTLPLPGGIALYDRYLEKQIDIVLISDMYLPKSVIEDILEKCGIRSYKNLYVSCEYAESKLNGRLYRIALNDEGVSPEEMIHFGDGIDNDYRVPRKLGIDARLVRNGVEISTLDLQVDKIGRRLKPRAIFDVRKLSNIYVKDKLNEIGYRAMGPLLLGFSQWLHERKEEYGLVGLYFLSRDGHILKNAYDLLYPGEKTSYVHVSRRSLTVPYICECSTLSDVINRAGLGRSISIRELLMRVGIAWDNCSSLFLESGFRIDDRIAVADLHKDSVISSILKRLWPKVIENSKSELSACMGYLDNAFPDGRVGVVDIGWRGSIQRALIDLMGTRDRNIEFYGLYVGLDRDSRWLDCQKMEGYLFDGAVGAEIQERLNLFTSMFEALFIAPHGSVEKYEVFDSGIRPVLLEAEPGIEDGTNPLFSIQEGALDFVKQAVRSNWISYFNFQSSDCLDELMRLGLNPTLDEAIRIGDIEFAYQDLAPLAKPENPFRYFCSPSKFFSDLGSCKWRTAFLVRLTKLPINYSRLLICVKKALRRDKK